MHQTSCVHPFVLSPLSLFFLCNCKPTTFSLIPSNHNSFCGDVFPHAGVARDFVLPWPMAVHLHVLHALRRRELVVYCRRLLDLQSSSSICIVLQVNFHPSYYAMSVEISVIPLSQNVSRSSFFHHHHCFPYFIIQIWFFFLLCHEY